MEQKTAARPDTNDVIQHITNILYSSKDKMTVFDFPIQQQITQLNAEVQLLKNKIQQQEDINDEECMKAKNKELEKKDREIDIKNEKIIMLQRRILEMEAQASEIQLKDDEIQRLREIIRCTGEENIKDKIN